MFSINLRNLAKFPDEIKALLKITPDLSQSMKDIEQRKGEPSHLSGGYEEFKTYLCRNMKTEN